MIHALAIVTVGAWFASSLSNSVVVVHAQETTPTIFDCDPCIDRPSFTVKAIVHGTKDDVFWKQVAAAMEQTAIDVRVTLDLQLYDAYDPETMAQDIRNVIGDGDDIPDALLVSIPEETVKIAVQEVIEANLVHVFGLNSGYEHAKELGLLGFVAMDEKLAGFKAGKRLLKVKPNATSALYINHQSGNTALDLRNEGLNEALPFVAQRVSVDDEPLTQEEAISVLVAGCRYEMILLAGAATVEATLAAIEEHGCEDVAVGTFDSSEAVNAAIAMGDMAFTVSQNQHLQGVLPMVLATIISTTGKTLALPADNDHGILLSGPAVITSENLPSDTWEKCAQEAFPVCPNILFDGNEASCACTEREGLTIAGVLHGITTDTFWDMVFAASETAANDMGVELLLERLEPAVSNEVIFSKMAAKIESYCNEGVDGIFVTIPSDVVIPAVQKCLDLHIPVININAGAEAATELGLMHHVGQLEYSAGYAAGMRLIDAGMQEGYCLSHQAGNSALVERCLGFSDALAEKGILYSGEHEVPADSDSSYVASVLKTVGKERSWEGVGLLLLGAQQIEPALQVKMEKPEVLLGAFDVSAQLYTALDDGTILFGIDQNAYLQGYFPIPLLTYAASSKQTLQNPVIESGPAFVTQSPSADQKVCEAKMFKTCAEVPGVDEDHSVDTESPEADGNMTVIIASVAAVGGVLLLVVAYFVYRSMSGAKGVSAASEATSPEDTAEIAEKEDQEQPAEQAVEKSAESASAETAETPPTNDENEG